MAAKAVAAPDAPEPLPKIGEDLFFIAMPMTTYRAISDEAAKRGITFSQGMQQAFSTWMGEVVAPKPTLLVEQGKK